MKREEQGFTEEGKTINEIRKQYGFPPIEDGDVVLISESDMKRLLDSKEYPD